MSNLGFYSIWPAFGCTAIVILLACTPLFAGADSPPSPKPNRIASLDGLRGFLALAVVFHHISVYHLFLLDGGWHLPPSRFYALLGPIGVSMFFMVTGYLFWSRLIRLKGRPEWLSLYVGRIFRIGPLYLAAASVVLLIVFLKTGLTLQVTKLHLTYQLVRLLALGLGGTLLPINAYQGTDGLLAGVTRTIRWEWMFYFTLPLIALFTRSSRLYLPFVAVSLVACLGHTALFHPQPSIALTALFLIGMLCASLEEKKLSLHIPDNVSSAAGVILLSLVLFFPSEFSTPRSLLLGSLFYLIISGCTMFGLLTARPAQRLGNISYGIYLLQGLALAVVFKATPLRDLAVLRPGVHWGLALLAVISLVALATLAHLTIEKPGITLGRLVNHKLQSAIRAHVV